MLAEPPSRWRGTQMDLQAIAAETDGLLGLDTLAQGLRYLGRRHLT
jgi:hypothetical protein